MPHLIISDEQIEGIVRFYAASATCQGDKLKWTPTCQGTNCGARMFPGFLLNLSLFLSSALGPSAWAVNSRLGQLAAARAHREDSARARRRRVKFFAQLSRKKAGRVWDSVPRSWWRQQAQERLKMSRWDIFRWRTLAGGPPCRQRRQRFSHRAFLSPRPKRVPPFGISDGGGTRSCAGRWRAALSVA